jgi:hypothetical protein
MTDRPGGLQRVRPAWVRVLYSDAGIVRPSSGRTVDEHAARPHRPGNRYLSSASSALSMRARAFSDSLEPVTPAPRNARRDSGFPAAASLRATSRA